MRVIRPVVSVPAGDTLIWCAGPTPTDPSSRSRYAEPIPGHTLDPG